MDVRIPLLLRKVVEGKSENYREVVAHWGPTVIALALAKLGNWRQAQEVTIEVFVQFFQQLQQIADFRQAYKNLVALTFAVLEDRYPEQRSDLSFWERVSNWDPIYRRVFFLKHGAELSYAQIAELLDLSLDRVRAIASKTLQLLAEESE